MAEQKETYLASFSAELASHMRFLLVTESQRIYEELTKNRINERDRESYTRLKISLDEFANFLYLTINDSIKQINIIEYYCLLASSNKNQEAQLLLQNIWCSLTKEQQEEAIKIINKSNKKDESWR